ncbi:Pkinase-domain-containing protein [Basidiobolus meristosporus CBS 931.73]|uniref:Pkinase-domain-containing protein n=1 Tax=Basidiobolus meristosporus CBS 931.73 TaxID=1314790 RepID=A0A1Y1Y3H7_9FUNG|nr:Pkinase-domain-containing protein [Basidiobolus meristosporus CBS 931.73]|eukprot:ORX92543.1 Pkinase-domain-containing protein [Basidiobolus meristosporus CBS 931.73]
MPNDESFSLLTPLSTPTTLEVLFTVRQYNVVRSLGSGSFSKVYLAEDSEQPGRLVALKMVELNCDQSTKQLISREIQMLKTLDHPNVVGFYESFETDTHFVLVLEYVQDGDLFDYVANHANEYCESKVQEIFKHIVDAVEYLHSKNICHRDLKLENILIQESSEGALSIKITDLGLAEFVDNNSTLTTRCGSEEYTAPEVILGQPCNGFKADVWSLGVILYTMLVGYLPFSMDGSQSRRSFFYRIANADYRLPRDRTISPEASDLLRILLQSNPKKRLEVSEIKKHPWLS